MKRTASGVVATMLLVLAVSPTIGEQRAPAESYDIAQVMHFSAKDGVEFPQNFSDALIENLVRELGYTGKFKLVLREGAVVDPRDKVLRISGTVIKFSAGSRAERYLVGFGAGKTKIVARVRFTDANSGKLLWEEQMDGRVWIGTFGGNSMGAAKALAKEAANKTVAHFFSN